jgi:thiol:disulfide interchange protein
MNNRKSFIVVSALVGLAIIFSGLISLSRDVSLKDWYSQSAGYASAFKQHQESNKPMVVLFYTDWCGSCKTLKADILSSPDVQAFLKNRVLAVKINPERDVDSANLAKQFGVRGYPMMFMVRNDGKDIQWIRKTSRITPAQFIAQLQGAIEQ